MSTTREGWPDPDYIPPGSADFSAPDGWRHLGSAEIAVLAPDERRQREDDLVRAYADADLGSWTVAWFWRELACLVGYDEAGARCQAAWEATWEPAADSSPGECSEGCGRPVRSGAKTCGTKSCQNRRYYRHRKAREAASDAT